MSAGRTSRRILMTMVLSLGAAGAAQAGPITSYTVMGTGGESTTIPEFSNGSFWWADYTGGVAGSPTLGSFGFNPVPGLPSYLDNSTGSLLLSNSFTLNDGDELSVDISVFSANADKGHVGFALLLENSTLLAILANIRADGETTPIDAPHPPSWDFAAPSAGVAVTSQTYGVAEMPDFALGGAQYGSMSGPGSCGGGSLPGCMTNVSSTYAPGAGTYQLLFGVYSFSGFTDSTRPTALAVQSVSVLEPVSAFQLSVEPIAEPLPEPGVWVLTGLGLLGLRAARRQPWNLDVLRFRRRRSRA